jgi:hypothetical protein
VFIDWGDDGGELPSKISGFVDLSELLEDAGISYGGVQQLSPGVYAILDGDKGDISDEEDNDDEDTEDVQDVLGNNWDDTESEVTDNEEEVMDDEDDDESMDEEED